MKIKKLFCAFLSAAAVFVCLPVSSAAAVPAAEYVPGEVIVAAKAPIADSDMSSFSLDDETPVLLNDCGVQSVEPLKIEAETYSNKSSAQNASYFYKLEVEGDVLEACENLSENSSILIAEPNYIYHTLGFTMPSEVTSSSTLYKTYQKWYVNDILHVPEAWETFGVAGEGVTVAVIDNGFDVNALDFPTGLWTDEKGNHGWNTCLNSADISPITKSDGTEYSNTCHGTHVASIIGMAENGRNGIGIAYKSNLMLLNAAHYNNDSKNPTFSSDDVAEAIDYARSNGADIINLSLGSSGPSSIMKLAIDRAYEAGVAVIAAAGNGYYNPDAGDNYPYSTETAVFYPAGFPNVIGVMAIDKSGVGQLAMFSNYDPTGKYYNIAAPGVNILGCKTASGLTMLMGTSQASPIVAACAALYLSAYPGTTVGKLYEAIKKSPTATVSANTVAAATETCRFKSLNALELLEYGKVKPVINTYENAIKIDGLGIIYQLDENFTDIANYFGVADGTGTYTFTPNPLGNGTGSLINVYNNSSKLYKSYRVVIFGDINGDCRVDAQDSIVLNCIVNGLLPSESWVTEASDTDYSGIIDSEDANLIEKHAIALDYISQLR